MKEETKNLKEKLKELKAMLKRLKKYLKEQYIFEAFNVQAEDWRLLPHSYYWRYPEEKVRELEAKEIERLRQEIEKLDTLRNYHTK